LSGARFIVPPRPVTVFGGFFFLALPAKKFYPPLLANITRDSYIYRNTAQSKKHFAIKIFMRHESRTPFLGRVP
jgi:hypothetical protein